MNYVLNPLATVGAVAMVLFAVGLWLDFQNFDQTRGGYEPPFQGVEGEPVNWFELDRTPTGVAKRGRVVNTLVDGTTGMISFEVYGVEVPFRPFSERALAVHKPREAFKALGFDPEF